MLGVVACAGGGQTELHTAAPRASGGVFTETATSASGGSGGSGGATLVASAEAGGKAKTPVVAAPAAAKSAAPPPDIPLTSARSAASGDGVWKRLGDEGTSGGFLYATTLHPHATSRFITVTLVALDLTLLRLGFMPGVEDVGKRKVPFVAGLVPAPEQPKLVAAFNGGFMLRHGRWGMQLGQTTLQAARDPGCTVAIDVAGAVRIRSWPELAPDSARFAAVRQTPPCLVENGALHPLLLKGVDKAWAGNTAGVVTRRRSGLGIDRDGKRLFYAVGLETSARLLAEGLKAAGAEHAAELDINWNWTRFLVFDENAEGALRVSKSLVEVDHSPRVYVERPSERDFFYVVRR